MASKMVVMAAALRRMNRSTCLWSARYGRWGDFLLREEFLYSVIILKSTVFSGKKFRVLGKLSENLYLVPGSDQSCVLVWLYLADVFISC